MLDGDLDLDIDDVSAVNGGRDSELDSFLLDFTKDRELEAVMSDASLDVSSLERLEVSSECGRSEVPIGLPIPCSEDVIEGDFQSLSSSLA